MYPVHLVLSNGATIRIRFKEPQLSRLTTCGISLPLPILVSMSLFFSVNLRFAFVLNPCILVFCALPFQVPVNLDECSEEERQRRLLRRKPRTRLTLLEEVEDTFNPDAYSFLWSKKQTER
ncbi:unnamed protein product [Schistocephalus solidus]|uniref:Uncharacterized protein n=1 Tax=Schistocephalus solidus TaxID=70667 RepID=A0A183SQK1_SCHSO|nr:unnamed protein product [Schistocephalus solidus]